MLYNMLCNSYITCNGYIVEWEITTNNYINVTWCLLLIYNIIQQTPNNSYITVSYNFPLNNITVTCYVTVI